eukprot:1178102-Prorocentrum_minimum.AAC.1
MGSGGGQEVKDWSSVDARKPQNPTKSEEYQRHPQDVLFQRRGSGGVRRGSGGGHEGVSVAAEALSLERFRVSVAAHFRRRTQTPVGVVYRAQSPSYWAAWRTSLPRPTS